MDRDVRTIEVPDPAGAALWVTSPALLPGAERRGSSAASTADRTRCRFRAANSYEPIVS